MSTSKENFSLYANLRYDAPAALVVFLVALPLCLGIALASGVPLFSGIIAGVVGGIVIGIFSRSPLSVSGPAAGLTIIVLGAVKSLPTLEAFFFAVFLAGIFQIALGLLRAGFIGDFVPSSVIKGMLAAIGLILILKQIPHALGFDKDYEGDFSFQQLDGENTFSEIFHLIDKQFTPGAILISILSLIFLFWWDGTRLKKRFAWLLYVPGPLIVVVFGVLANAAFTAYSPLLTITSEHLVSIPISNSMGEFFAQFKVPDFSLIFDFSVLKVAGTLGLVASLETLLSVEAVDKLDPFKRVSPANRELFAQGLGNMTSGLLGGLPVTSVIVRSSANVSSGARTRMSTILHGVLLLVCVLAIPGLLNKIPYAALAAVLLSVGYKLTKPALFFKEYEKGWAHIIPFVVTILAILLTDLLIGIGIGLLVGAAFVIFSNYQSAIVHIEEGDSHLIRFKKDMSFIHKKELREILASIPDNTNVVLDLGKTRMIDLDNIEIINDFLENAKFRGITTYIKNLEKHEHITHDDTP